MRCTSGDDGPQLFALGGAGDTGLDVVVLVANPNLAGVCRGEVAEPVWGLLGAALPVPTARYLPSWWK
jgi:hypothetical protein